MRRSILIAFLITAALVIAVFTSKRSATRPPPPDEPDQEEVERRPATHRWGPTRSSLGLEGIRDVAPRGLCGTEIAPPTSGVGQTEVPHALRELTAGVPTAAAVAAAAREWGITSPEGAEVAAMAAEAAASLTSLQERVSAPVSDAGPSGWYRRARELRDLGRPQEGLKAARYAFARQPSADGALVLAALLDDVGEADEARQVLRTELARDPGPVERAWLTAELGFICATRHDASCAAQSVQDLDGVGVFPELGSFTRGVAATFAGQLEEARAEYLKALRSDHDFATLNNLAEVESCGGRLAESQSRWVDALEASSRPDSYSNALSGLAATYLRQGDAVPAWLFASASLAGAGGNGHASGARSVMALAALTLGDLAEARAQVARAQAANPYDDLIRRRCFAHPAEEATLRALVSESRGDLEAAKEAWIQVARSDHGALSRAARVALSELCA